MRYDVVIIGAGLGGLECAALLSRQGKKVCVLERQNAPGGSMQSILRYGLRLDTGLHYIGGLDSGQPLYNRFKSLGLMELPWQELDPEGFDLITIDGDTFRFAKGFENFADTMAGYFPKEKDSLSDYSAMLASSGNMTPFENASAWEYLHSKFHDELLINVLSGSSMKLELNRESLPLFVFAHINAPFIQSSWRLKGDGNLIVRHLIDDIVNNGGDVFCNSDVSRLTVKDGFAVSAITQDDKCFEGSLFISNAHPAVTTAMICDCKNIKPSYRFRMSDIKNTYGIFTVSLQLKPDSIRYFNHNKYIYCKPNVWDFYKENGPVSGVMVCCRVPDDGSDYTQNIDILTPMLYDRLVQWYDTKAGRRGDEYIQFKNRIADECIGLASTIIPDLKDNITHRCISTPLTWRDYNGNPEGSAYGARKDWNTPLMSYMSPTTPIPNLLMTGQSLVLHGIQGVTETAFETVRLINR